MDNKNYEIYDKGLLEIRETFSNLIPYILLIIAVILTLKVGPPPPEEIRRYYEQDMEIITEYNKPIGGRAY